MKLSPRLLSVLYQAGAIAAIAGILDPLEGSVVIVIGSSLLAFSTMMDKKPEKNWFLAAWVMVVVGVFYLFFISSLGGFLGDTGRSWIWGLPIVPYPLGWILTMVLLIRRLIRSRKSRHSLPDLNQHA